MKTQYDCWNKSLNLKVARYVSISKEVDLIRYLKKFINMIFVALEGRGEKRHFPTMNKQNKIIIKQKN